MPGVFIKKIEKLNYLNFKIKVQYMLCFSLIFLFIMIENGIGPLNVSNSINPMAKMSQQWKQRLFGAIQLNRCQKDNYQSSINILQQDCSEEGKNKNGIFQLIANYFVNARKYINRYQSASSFEMRTKLRPLEKNSPIEISDNYQLTLSSTSQQSSSNYLIQQKDYFKNQNMAGIHAIEQILSPSSLYGEVLNDDMPRQSLTRLDAGADIVLPQHLVFPQHAQFQNPNFYYMPNEYKTFSHKSFFSNSFFDRSYNFSSNLIGSLSYSEDVALNGNYAVEEPEPLNPVKASVDRKFRYVLMADFLEQRLSLMSTFSYMIRQNPIRDLKRDSKTFYVQRDKQVHQGVEFSGIAKVTENWRVLTSLAYAHASITKDSETGVTGNTPRKVPRWKARIRNQLAVIPITGFAMYFDTVYLGVRPGDDLNTSNLPSQIKMGIGFGYKRSWKEDRISIATEVTNLIGTRYIHDNRHIEMLDRIPDDLKLTFDYKF